MDFVRLNTHYRPVSCMVIRQLLDKAHSEDIVVRIVQRSTCCEPRSGDMGQRVEVDSIDGPGYQVDECQTSKSEQVEHDYGRNSRFEILRRRLTCLYKLDVVACRESGCLTFGQH
jgi:hypothetical protein